MRQLLLVLLLLFLGVGCGSSPTEQGATAEQDRMGWRKLSRGMSQDKVRAILGEPMRVENQEGVTCWYYQEGMPLERDALDATQWRIPRGAVLFSSKGAGDSRLIDWREP